MLSDKIRLLEEAADRAQAAEADLSQIKTDTSASREQARVTYEAVIAFCKVQVDEATAVHQAALRDVEKYKADVRAFIDDILPQVGRVRQ